MDFTNQVKKLLDILRNIDTPTISQDDLLLKQKGIETTRGEGEPLVNKTATKLRHHLKCMDIPPDARVRIKKSENDEGVFVDGDYIIQEDDIVEFIKPDKKET